MSELLAELIRLGERGCRVEFRSGRCLGETWATIAYWSRSGWGVHGSVAIPAGTPDAEAAALLQEAFSDAAAKTPPITRDEYEDLRGAPPRPGFD